MRVHLDTDFAGDPDDACALGMLLGWPGVEIAGITTTDDPGGQRAGYVAEFLAMAGRDDIQVAAGAERSLTSGKQHGGIPSELWPRAVEPRPARARDAVDLLAANIASGATVVAIGPYTNLARLEAAQPGALHDAPVVTMGGWVEPPPAGFPPWEAEFDWNVQCDTRAARTVFENAAATVLPVSVTARVALRASALPALRATGPLGALLADQSRAHGEEYGFTSLGRAYPRLPDDLVNFHHDPLAVAVALGWEGVTVEARRLAPVLDGGALRLQADAGGRLLRLVTAVDARAFGERWLEAIAAAHRSS